MSLSSTHTRRTLIPNLHQQPSSSTGQIHLQDITKLTIIERPNKKCKLVFGTLSLSLSLSLSQESNWASMAESPKPSPSTSINCHCYHPHSCGVGFRFGAALVLLYSSWVADFTVLSTTNFILDFFSFNFSHFFFVGLVSYWISQIFGSNFLQAK